MFFFIYYLIEILGLRHFKVMINNLRSFKIIAMIFLNISFYMSLNNVQHCSNVFQSLLIFQLFNTEIYFIYQYNFTKRLSKFFNFFKQRMNYNTIVYNNAKSIFI